MSEKFMIVERKNELFSNERVFLGMVIKMLKEGKISDVSYNMLMNLYTAKFNLISKNNNLIKVNDNYQRNLELNKLKSLGNKVMKNPDLYNLYVNLLETYETGIIDIEVRSVFFRLMAYLDMNIDIVTYDDAEVINYTFDKLVKDIINGNFHDHFMNKEDSYARIRK